MFWKVRAMPAFGDLVHRRRHIRLAGSSNVPLSGV
jgi:hypothetical protein